MAEHSPDPSAPPAPTAPPRFRGRAAVVTGGARGIGRAIAVYLAREGCDLVVGDILEDLPDGTPYGKATQADLDETTRLVQAEGVRCIAAKMDVRDPAQAKGLIDRATGELGRLDFLIANAALTIEQKITDMSPETFDTVLRSNLNGVFHVLSPALAVMTAQERGRVIIISSAAAGRASPRLDRTWRPNGA
jgi:NAD(P)-dependent dehydrogenase (short-subunit alcohol dehydrogenase family)